jgi:hypothetical protein
LQPLRSRAADPDTGCPSKKAFEAGTGSKGVNGAIMNVLRIAASLLATEE